MSRYYFDNEKFDVMLGYDENGDYIYLVIDSDPSKYQGNFPFGTDEPIYSNLYFDYGTRIKDINFYTKLAKEKFDIDIPKDIIQKINNDIPK